MAEAKKLGVYVDGKLKLQTRNADKAYAAADKWIRKRHDVWVVPIGAFVTV